MRHGKKVNHLGRTSAHRQALLSNMASSLILNKRITTTLAKAKELRKYVEPLITKAKTDSTHSRRIVFSYLQNKDSVTTLFGEVAGRTSERKGGYTRIIKLSDPRLGDAADMCLMELVDFNDLYKKDGAGKKTKTRRGRKGKKEDSVEGEVTPAASAEEKPKKAAKKTSKKKD
jgi:large subunit ribosomal protein L17